MNLLLRRWFYSEFAAQGRDVSGRNSPASSSTIVNRSKLVVARFPSVAPLHRDISTCATSMDLTVNRDVDRCEISQHAILPPPAHTVSDGMGFAVSRITNEMMRSVGSRTM